jgi:surface-anchored protein
MTHVHVEAVYNNGALGIQLNDTVNNVIYQPDDAEFYVSAYAEQIQPAGYNFIGAGAGNTYWLLPQATDLNQITVAFSSEPINPGTFDQWQPYDPRITRPGEWIKFSMINVQGPGDVSIWQNGQAPNAWWASTVDGGRRFDPAVFVESGGHTHYNWGFSAAGDYAVTFDASAFPLGGHGLPIHSGYFTLHFAVESAPVVNLSGNPGSNDYATIFHTGGPAVNLAAPNATITSNGSQTLTSLVVTLTNNPDGLNEMLSADVGSSGLSVVWDPNSATLTISGSASLATYQSVLQTITYSNTSATPDPSDRIIQFVATDDQGVPSFISTTTVSIQ